jgi:hypothetical protein
VQQRIKGGSGLGPASGHHGRGAGRALGGCGPHGLFAVIASAG